MKTRGLISLILRSKQAGSGILDVIFPNPCPGCASPLIDNKLPICAQCAFFLERVDQHTVQNSICKLPQACDAFAHTLCLWMFDKSGVLQRIHQELKYNNRPHTGIALGRLMGSALLLPLSHDRLPDMVIPIPLHRRRMLERGYNQSNMIAKGMAKTISQTPVTDILFRKTYTRTQTSLAKGKRFENVSNAFAVSRSEKIKGRHVMLVDDVLTTGATLLAASIPLRQAGAHKISFATLALARDGI